MSSVAAAVQKDNDDVAIEPPAAVDNDAKKAVKKVKRRKLVANVSRSKYDIGECCTNISHLFVDTDAQ